MDSEKLDVESRTKPLFAAVLASAVMLLTPHVVHAGVSQVPASAPPVPRSIQQLHKLWAGKKKASPFHSDVRKEAERLTLTQAFQRATAQNFTYKQAQVAYRQARLAYDEAWAQLFIPNLSFEANAGTITRTFGNFPHLLEKNPDTSTYRTGYPTGTRGTLTLGSFTIFNGWRDSAGLGIAQTDLAIAEEAFKLAERMLRNEVISSFYSFKAEQERLDVAKRSLDMAEAIRELVESQIAVRKAGSSDLSSSDVDVADAKTQVNEAETSYSAALWTLNTTLNDPIGTEYVVVGELSVKPLQLTLEETIQLYYEHSPDIRTAQLKLKKADATEQKEKLALTPGIPTIEFSGIQVNWGNSSGSLFGSNGSVSPGLTSGTPNWEVSTALSLKIPILTPDGGFLNRRAIERATLNREAAQLTFDETMLNLRRQVNELWLGIKQQEKSIEFSRQSFEASNKVLDGLFSKLSADKVDRLQLRDALTRARQANITYIESQLNFLRKKLNFAEKIGIQAFSEDKFE